jgi:hypothetical protein
MQEGQFIAGDEIWPSLRSRAVSSSGRRIAVTAYLGAGASEMLPLRKDDILLCALSLSNCRAGTVYPSEIRLLMNNGVKVYTDADLHAKLYIFGEFAFVCSANMSRRSEHVLVEAGVWVHGVVVREIQEWVEKRLGDPVRPFFLDECEREFRPNVFGGEGAGGTKERGQDAPPREGQVWLLKTESSVVPEKERRAAELGETDAQQKLDRPSDDVVRTIRWPGAARMVPGDTILQLASEQEGVRVYPHGKLLHKKVIVNSRRSATYLYIELPRQFRTMGIVAFYDECERAGYKLPTVSGARLVNGRAAALVLKQAASPDKLRCSPGQGELDAPVEGSR